MKILGLFKKDNKDKRTIYQNANDSFDFDHSVTSATCDDSTDGLLFTNANKNIDTSVTYEIKEVDYYA